MDLAVKVDCSADARSADPIPRVAFSTSAMMSTRSRKFPSWSWTATAVSPIMIDPFFIFDVRSRMTAASCVPAWDPFVPWLAMASRSATVVSSDWSAAFMFAAEFLKASPSCSVLVFE